MCLSLNWHLATDDDWDWEDDEEEVGDDVADSHGQELSIALSAASLDWWVVLIDLPVLGDWLALCHICYDDKQERQEKEESYREEHSLIALLPY